MHCCVADVGVSPATKSCIDEEDDDGLHQDGRGGESKRAILWMY